MLPAAAYNHKSLIVHEIVKASPSPIFIPIIPPFLLNDLLLLLLSLLVLLLLAGRGPSKGREISLPARSPEAEDQPVRARGRDVGVDGLDAVVVDDGGGVVGVDGCGDEFDFCVGGGLGCVSFGFLEFSTEEFTGNGARGWRDA